MPKDTLTYTLDVHANSVHTMPLWRPTPGKLRVFILMHLQKVHNIPIINPTENQHQALHLGAAFSSLFCQTDQNNASSFQITDSCSQLMSSFKSAVHYRLSAEWQKAKVTSGWWGESDILPAKDIFFSGVGRLRHVGLSISGYRTFIYQLVRKMIPTGCPCCSVSPGC